MAAPGSKSKKGSGASYVSKSPHDLVLFADKCLGLNVVPEALRALGFTVERKTDHFPQDTADSVWLEEVGKKGWIVLSKDQSLRHNHIEIVALLKSNTHSFILTSASLTGPEMAAAFTAAVPQMLGVISRVPAPVVCSVSKGGNVSVKYTYEELARKASEVSVAVAHNPRVIS